MAYGIAIIVPLEVLVAKAQEALAAGVQASAVELVAETEGAPEMPVDTGELQGSVTVIAVEGAGTGAVSATVGSDVEHAGYQESGTIHNDATHWLSGPARRHAERHAQCIAEASAQEF